MSKLLKARVHTGRFTGEIVRITNVSTDELGRRFAACILSNGSRANISVNELDLLQKEPEPEIKKARTASMPFIGGSTSSRTMTHTKNMAKTKREAKAPLPSKKQQLALCEACGMEYNLEARKGMPGKINECENCAHETETLMEGRMVFSHKTGATIEIKQDGELRHEAETFDPKNKTS